MLLDKLRLKCHLGGYYTVTPNKNVPHLAPDKTQ